MGSLSVTDRQLPVDSSSFLLGMTGVAFSPSDAIGSALARASHHQRCQVSTSTASTLFSAMVTSSGVVLLDRTGQSKRISSLVNAR